jgi:hypothetical protein
MRFLTHHVLSTLSKVGRITRVRVLWHFTHVEGRFGTCCAVQVRVL